MFTFATKSVRGFLYVGGGGLCRDLSETSLNLPEVSSVDSSGFLQERIIQSKQSAALQLYFGRRMRIILYIGLIYSILLFSYELESLLNISSQTECASRGFL